MDENTTPTDNQSEHAEISTNANDTEDDPEFTDEKKENQEDGSEEEENMITGLISAFLGGLSKVRDPSVFAWNATQIILFVLSFVFKLLGCYPDYYSLFY